LAEILRPCHHERADPPQLPNFRERYFKAVRETEPRAHTMDGETIAYLHTYGKP
jgi:hypothetical protein